MSVCPYEDWWHGEPICGLSGPTPCFQATCHGEDASTCPFPEWRGQPWRAVLFAIMNAACIQELALARWHARRAKGDVVKDPGSALALAIACGAAKVAYDAVGWRP